MTLQLPPPSRARFRLARAGDPATSHAAARTVNITRRQRECFNTMNTRPDYCWGAWEVDLAAGTTGLWKRMNELHRRGWVTKVGMKRGPHRKWVETFRVVAGRA